MVRKFTASGVRLRRSKLKNRFFTEKRSARDEPW